MEIKDYLNKQLGKVATSLEITGATELVSGVTVERPTDFGHGDYTSNLALILFSHGKKSSTDFSFKSPRELATHIADTLQKIIATDSQKEWIKSITIAGPGFINIALSDEYYIQLLSQLISPQEKVLKGSKTAQTYLIEYISPNTNKPLHIGHLRNGALGAAMANILEKNGNTVIRAIEYNNRGLHIIKSVWSYLLFGKKGQTQKIDPLVIDWAELLEEWLNKPENWLIPSDMNDERIQKADHFVGYWYQLADEYAENESIQKVWATLLQTWENSGDLNHTNLRKLWARMNDWFYEGYQQTTALYGATFDPNHISYESEIYAAGREIVLDGAKKGIFTQLPDGAIKAELSSYNLPDKILLRKDGTGIYMTFDIELTRQRSLEKVDHLLWVVGNDQDLYFQQLFAIAELLGYGNKEKYHHFSYGMVRLPEGKMSSRKGKVIYGDDLLALAQEKAAGIMQESGVSEKFTPEEFAQVVKAVGIGAIKWTMLSHDKLSEIIFDINESVSFTGFAGPYIQYTIARSHSVLQKAKISSLAIPIDILIDSKEQSLYQLNQEERDVLLNLSLYFDTVEKTVAEYAPHHLCIYLYTLAQSFNTFYAHQKIVSLEEKDAQQTQIRLALTSAVQKVLSEGLNLLGIQAIERM